MISSDFQEFMFIIDFCISFYKWIFIDIMFIFIYKVFLNVAW